MYQGSYCWLHKPESFLRDYSVAQHNPPTHASYGTRYCITFQESPKSNVMWPTNHVVHTQNITL